MGLVSARGKLGYRWGDRRRDAKLTHPIDGHNAPQHYAQAPVHLLREAFVTRYPKARCMIVAQDVDRPYAKRFGDLAVTVRGLDAAMHQLKIWQ